MTNLHCIPEDFVQKVGNIIVTNLETIGLKPTCSLGTLLDSVKFFLNSLAEEKSFPFSSFPRALQIRCSAIFETKKVEKQHVVHFGHFAPLKFAMTNH
jgi:hypothetical protein